MILIVVTVHAVSPDQEEVVELIGKVPDDFESVVTAKIGRLGFGHADHHAVQRIFTPDEI